jgi:hypothetical protein
MSPEAPFAESQIRAVDLVFNLPSFQLIGEKSQFMPVVPKLQEVPEGTFSSRVMRTRMQAV